MACKYVNLFERGQAVSIDRFLLQLTSQVAEANAKSGQDIRD